MSNYWDEVTRDHAQKLAQGRPLNALKWYWNIKLLSKEVDLNDTTSVSQRTRNRYNLCPVVHIIRPVRCITKSLLCDCGKICEWTREEKRRLPIKQCHYVTAPKCKTVGSSAFKNHCSISVQFTG